MEKGKCLERERGKEKERGQIKEGKGKDEDN
jgi:hypothetical protein